MQHWDSYCLSNFFWVFVGDVQHWDSYCLSINSFCFVLLVMCNTGIVTVCLLTLFVGDVQHWIVTVCLLTLFCFLFVGDV